jgi:hypothetical protein
MSLLSSGDPIEKTYKMTSRPDRWIEEEREGDGDLTVPISP